MYSSNQQKQISFFPKNVFAALLMVLFMAAIVAVGVDPGLGWASQEQPQGSGPSDDDRYSGKSGAHCLKTAFAAFKSCHFEVQEEFWMAVGKCANLSNGEAAAECRASARKQMEAAKRLCGDQRDARYDVCDDLGQAPYEPALAPEDFIDPEDITPANANPYFPLVPGTQWVYEGETEEGLEVITVTVTDKIKEIEYPAESGQIFACVVVRDIVEVDGELLEDTDDWYAQDLKPVSIPPSSRRCLNSNIMHPWSGWFLSYTLTPGSGWNWSM